MRRALLLLSTMLCSGLAVPALAGDIVPPKIMTLTPGGINVVDSSYNYRVTDLSIGTIEVECFYNGIPPNQSGGPPRDPNVSV